MDKILEIAKKLNTRLNVKNFSIPVLDGFKVIETKNSNVLFVAKNGNQVEQFLMDGALEENETVKDRINKILKETKKYLIENKVGTYITFYKDYDNKKFKFKILAQDIQTFKDNELVTIRELNAYFIEPTTKEFYQINVSSGPYKLEQKELLKNIKNIKEDKIIIMLDKMLLTILDNIKYNEREQ